MLNTISKIVIPLFVIFVIINGLRKKVDIYNSFLKKDKMASRFFGLLFSFCSSSDLL